MVAVAMVLSSRFVDYHLVFARDLRLNARHILELKLNFVGEVFLENPAHVGFSRFGETGLLHNADCDQVVLAINDLEPVHKLALAIDHIEPAPKDGRDHPAIFSFEDFPRAPEEILDDLELPPAGTIGHCRASEIAEPIAYEWHGRWIENRYQDLARFGPRVVLVALDQNVLLVDMPAVLGTERCNVADFARAIDIGNRAAEYLFQRAFFVLINGSSPADGQLRTAGPDISTSAADVLGQPK